MKARLNSNKELVEEIRAKIQENGGFCPCSLEKNEKTKCMCEDFINQTVVGECHCGLYVKEEV